MKHKLNRLTALLLAVVMTFSMLLIPVEAASFTDVSGKAWYKSAVDFVSEKGFMAGVSETRFAPEANVTRAMFVTVLARFAGVEVKNDTTVFTDVRRDKWYTGAVTWAAQNGLVSGVGDGRFAPNAEITRQDLCAILRKFLSAEDVSLTLGEGAAFTDAQRVSSYAREAVRYCAQTGLITGFKDGSFRPKETATRAQVAAILMKLYKLSGGIAPRPAQTFQSEGDASMSVTVNAPAGALPENASMTVSRITDEAELAELAAKVSGDVVAAADISFTRDGAELEPKAKVEVQIALDGVENLKNPTVAHIRDDGTVEYLSAEVVSLSRAAEGKVLRFYAQSFSVYVVVEGDETTPSYVTFEFYGRKQVNGNAVAGPSANEADWEKINTQKVRIDGAGTGFARQLYDPGVPTMSTSQLFDGWSVDKRDFALTDEAKTVGDLNAELNRGNYNAGQTVKVYAMVYEVVRVRFFNQSNMLVWSESVRRVQSGDQQKADVTMYGAMQPLVSSMEFLGWTERKNVESAGEMPTYKSDPPTLYDANTTYTFGVTGTDALEFYPYVKNGHWLYFDVNVENNNKRNGFDDPTPSTLVSPIFVAEGQTPTQPADPVRAGYVFAGWYRDPDCNVPADFNEPLLAKTTFYAKWDFGTTTCTVVVYKQSETDTDFTLWTPYIDGEVYSVTYDVQTGDEVRPTDIKLKNDSSKNVTQLGGEVGSKLGYYFKYDPDHTTPVVRAYGDGSSVLSVAYIRRIITMGFYNYNRDVTNGEQDGLIPATTFRDENGNVVQGYAKNALYEWMAGYYDSAAVLWSSDPKYLDDEKYDYIPKSVAEFWVGSAGQQSVHAARTTAIKILQGRYGAPIPSGVVPEIPQDEKPASSKPFELWATRTPHENIMTVVLPGAFTHFRVLNPFESKQTTQNWSVRVGVIKGTKYQYSYWQNLPAYSVNDDGEEPRFSNTELNTPSNFTFDGKQLVGGTTASKWVTDKEGNRSEISGNEREGFRLNNYVLDNGPNQRSYTYYANALSSTGVPYDITTDYDYVSQNGRPSQEKIMFVISAGEGTSATEDNRYMVGAMFVNNRLDLYYERARFTITFWDKDQAGEPIVQRKLYYERDLNVLLNRDPDAASKLNSLASHDGFYFDGWFTDPEFTQPFSFDQKMPAHDVEVYSKWTPIRYRVLIDYTGGDSDAWIVYPDGTDTGATFVFDHGEVIPTQDFLSFARRPDDDGFPYTFAGWFLDSSFTTPYNAKEPISDNMVFGDDLYYGDPNGAESDSDFLARMASDSRIGVDPVNSYVSYDDRWTDRSEFNCSIRRVIRLYAKWNKELPDGSSVHVKYWGNHDLKDDQGAFDATGTGTNREHEWVDPDEYVIGSWTQGQAASVPVTPATVNDPERRFLYWEHVKGDTEAAFKPTAGKDYVYPGQRFQVLESDLCLVEKDREDPYPYCKHLKDGHKAIAHAEEPATCTASGLKAYYTCSNCGRKFGDANLSEPVEIIPALGHDWANQTYTWSVDNGTEWTAGVNAMPTCAAYGKCARCGDEVNEYGKVTATEITPATTSAAGSGEFTVSSFVNSDVFSTAAAGKRTYTIPQLTKVDVTYYYSDARSETVTVDAGDVTLRGSSVPDGFTVPYGYELVGWAESRVASTLNAPAYTPVGGTKRITNNASLYAVYRATTNDRGEKFVPVTGAETGGRFVITSGNTDSMTVLRSLYTDGLYSDSELGGAVSYTASGLHLGSGYLSNVGSGLVFTLSGGKLTGAGSKQLSTADGLSMADNGSSWTVSANEVASGSSKLAYSGGVFTTASSASGIYVWKASGEQDVEYTYAYDPTALTTFDVTCNGTKVGTANAGAAIELPQPTVPSGKTFLGWVIGSYSEQASMPEGNVYYAGTKLTSGMTLTALYRYDVDTCELSSNVTVGTGDEYYITSGTSGEVYILGADNTCSTTTITNGRPNASDANKVVLTNESGRVQIKNVSTGKYLYLNISVGSFQYTNSASSTTGFKSVSNSGTATRVLYTRLANGANYYLSFQGNVIFYSESGSVYAWKIVKGTRYATDASTTFSAAADHATRGVKSGASALRGSDSFAFQTGNRVLPERLGVESFRSEDKKETGFGESSLTRQDAPAVRAPVNTTPRGDGTPVYRMASRFSTYKDYLIVLVWGGRTYLLTHECTNGVIAPKLVPVDVNADGTITGSYDNYLFKATMERNYPGFVLESMENNTETFQYLMANGLDVKLDAYDPNANADDMPFWNYDGNAHRLYNTRIDRDENYLYMNFASKIAEMKAMNMATETYIFERVDGRYTVTLYYYDSSSGEPVWYSLAFTVPAGATLDAASADSLTIYNDRGYDAETQAEFEAYVKGFLKNGAPEFNFGTDKYRFSRWKMSGGRTYLGNEVTANTYLVADYEQNPDVDFGKWVPYTPSKLDPALDYLVVLEGDHSMGQPDVALCSFNPYAKIFYGEGADIATATTEYVTAYTGQVAYDDNGNIVGIRTDGNGNPYNWTQDMIEWYAPEDVPQAGDKILIQKMPSAHEYYAWNFSKPTGGEMTCDNFQARNSKFILEHSIFDNGYQVDWAALTLKDDPASEWLYDAQQHSLSTNRRSLYLGFNFTYNTFDQRMPVFDNCDRYYALCTWVEKENRRAAVKLYVRESKVPQNTVTITFHNGNETETQVVYVNDPTELFPNRFEKEGYTFMSWNTDPNGNGTVYGDEELIRIQSKLDLYAQWQEIKTNDQRWEETTVIEEGKDYLIGVEINGQTYLLVNKNEFSTQPYSFYDHDAVHAYEFGYLAPAIMSETETDIVTGVSGDAAQDLYYCRWNFHGSSGKYLISSGSDSSYFLTLGGDPDWYGVFPSKRGDYWTYSDNNLFVAFEDGTAHYLAPVDAHGEATAASDCYAGSNQTGYTVKLYQRASEGATWDVRFVNTDGVTLRPGQWVKDGDTAVLPADPTQEGYYFAGWFLKGASEYFDFDTPITGDTVLEARFVPKKDVGYFVNLRAVYIQLDTEHAKIRWFGNNDPTGETGGDLYLSQKDVTDSTTGSTVHSVTFDLDEKTGIPVPTSVYNNGLSSTGEHPIYDKDNSNHLTDMTGDPSGLYYDDYEFVGWSLQPTGPGMTGDAHPDLNESDLTLKWIPAQTDPETGEVTTLGHFVYNKNYDNPDAEPEWVDATEVASDSSLMTNAFYAVWRPKYYYVYHSATGDLERREIQYVDDKGNDTNEYKDGTKIKPVDLVESTAPGTRYGGYYKTYGGVNTDYVDATKKVGTAKSGWMPGETALHALIDALQQNVSVGTAEMNELITALSPAQRKILAETVDNPKGWTDAQLKNLNVAQMNELINAIYAAPTEKENLVKLSNSTGWILAPTGMHSDTIRDLIDALIDPDKDVSTAFSALIDADKTALASALGVETVTQDKINSLTVKEIATLKALATESVDAVWRTDTDVALADGLYAEFKDYDGYMKYKKDGKNTAYWTKKQAYSVSGLEDPEAIADVYGETMRPTPGTVYYLKEVPAAYLASKLFFVYRNNKEGDGSLEGVEFVSLNMVAVVDDSYYKRIGYEVKPYNPETGEEVSYEFYRGSLAKSFSIAKQTGTNYESAVTVNSGSYEDLNIDQGYVSVVRWKEDPMTRAFYCEPMWTTLDGVDVIATENERFVDMDDPIATLSTVLTLDLHNVTLDGANETSDWAADGYGFKVRIISRDGSETRWLDVDEDDGDFTVAIPDLGVFFKTMQIVRYETANAAAFTGNKGDMSKVDGKTVLFDIDFTAKTVTDIVVYPSTHPDDEGNAPTMQ